jgi:hypothetical protein
LTRYLRLIWTLAPWIGGCGAGSQPCRLCHDASTPDDAGDAATDAAAFADSGPPALETPSGGCAPHDPSGYGQCGTLLGAVYDGTRCKAVQGCTDTSNRDELYSSEASCAVSCAHEGKCDESKLNGPLVRIGGYCDYIDHCLQDPHDSSRVIAVTRSACSEDPVRCGQESECLLAQGVTIDGPVWEEICAASLLDVPGAIDCHIEL